MDKLWLTSEKTDEATKKKFPGLHPVILQLLYNRNLKDPQAVDGFFNLRYDGENYDPFLFRRMSAAVDLIIKHIKNKRRILVYGDYDADGVTATALLQAVLTTVKAEVDLYIPDRIVEGYGLNIKALDEIIKKGVGLVITVDSGIRNKDEVAHLVNNQIDVIITDHHVPPAAAGDLPDCLIINPQSEDETYPGKNLCGVGVAYKLASAIIERSKLDNSQKYKLIRSCLDLVAIGTVADCVSVLGENRYLIKEGLSMLRNTKRRGLVALKKAAGIDSGKEISAWQIGFQIAPRLNAAGRMDHANTSLNLLIAGKQEEAEQLADRLNENNSERQKETETIFLEVEAQLKSQINDLIMVGICHFDEATELKTWNEGVIGLVAGKIAEKYSRPVLVVTQTAEGYKGSGRSTPDFNLIEAIAECSGLLDKFGGHKGAAGFSLPEENLENFVAKMKVIAEKRLHGLDLRPKIYIESELPLQDINDDFFTMLKKFEPFGQDNERPKFVSYALKVLDVVTMGADGRHLKLRVKDDTSRVYSAVGFGQAEIWSHIKIGDAIDLVYYLDNNEFNGRNEIQLKIVDIKKH